MKKQTYKLEFSKKWRIYNVFHLSLLEQNITKKRGVDKNVTRLEFEARYSEEYEVKAIRDSAVYEKELESGQLPGLYYLVLWKGYGEEENTGEPLSTVQYLRRMINSFHKDHSDKPTATSPAVNTASSMYRSTAKPTKPTKSAPKQKRGGSAKNRANKQAKNGAG